jgi:hypothetical protein
LLQALGRLGPEQRVASTELIQLSRELGAKPCCFTDTLDEVEGIHRYTCRCLASRWGRRRPLWGAAEYLIAEGKSISDIEIMIAHLPDELSGLGIAVHDRPAPVGRWTLDEADLEARLQAEIGYHSEATRRHDLNALTAVHRLRGGEWKTSLETSQAVFVTTNTAVARVSRQFFREHYGRRLFAPVCMPDHQFATLAWLKKPLRAPDLPTKYVIADAFAGLNPPESLWRAYLRECARLEKQGGISTDDYYLLRCSPAAKEALMGTTVGGSRAFLEGSVPDILARARAAERADAERRLTAETQRREMAEAATARERADAEARLGALTAAHAAELQDMEARHTQELQVVHKQRGYRLSRYETAAHLVARLPCLAIVGVFTALAVAYFYDASPWKPFGNLPEWVPAHPVYGFGVFVVTLVALVITLRGGSVMGAVGRVDQWMTHKISARLARMIEGSDSDAHL